MKESNSTELVLTTARRHALYRQIDAYHWRVKHSTNKRDELEAITNELANWLEHQQSIIAVAADALQTVFAEFLHGSERLNKIVARTRPDREKWRPLAVCRLIAKLVALWGYDRIKHYNWENRPYEFVQKLFRASQHISDWELFVRYSNAVMLARHNAVKNRGVRTGNTPIMWTRIGFHPRGTKDNYHTPLTTWDMTHILEWRLQSRVNIADETLEDIESATENVNEYQDQLKDLGRDKYGMLVPIHESLKQSAQTPLSPSSKSGLQRKRKRDQPESNLTSQPERELPVRNFEPAIGRLMSNERLLNPNPAVGSTTTQCPICRASCRYGRLPAQFPDNLKDRTHSLVHETHALKDMTSNNHCRGKAMCDWIESSPVASMGSYREDTIGFKQDEDVEVLVLTEECFRRITKKGAILDRPAKIVEKFKDSDMFSPQHFAEILRNLFPSGSVNGNLSYQSSRLRDEGEEHQTIHASELAKVLESETLSEERLGDNFLGLNALARADRSCIDASPRYSILKRTEQRMLGKLIGPAKPDKIIPFDITGCLRFDIFGFKGAFSGAHLDALLGTWIRNLFGIKAWMFVRDSDMTPDDWKDLAREGSHWNPKGKGRIIFLEPNDVFFMPPGIRTVHAVFTLETSLMEGGMVWDENTLIPTLKHLFWLCKNQMATNEAVIYQLFHLIIEIKAIVSENPTKYATLNGYSTTEEFERDFNNAIRNLESIPCKCKNGRCGKNCSCRLENRRCILFCGAHNEPGARLPGMEGAKKCFQDPLCG